MRTPILSHSMCMCHFPYFEEECILLICLELIHFVDSMRVVVTILTIDVKLVSLHNSNTVVSENTQTNNIE